jgi:DNA-directed RNA polymerase specialized sigma24 family protein
VDAFRHFVDRYQARAIAHARILTRNDADAADAAQEASFDAVERASSTVPRSCSAAR